MRKKIFLTFIMIFAVTLIVAFVGCSNKDDEPDNGNGGVQAGSTRYKLTIMDENGMVEDMQYLFETAGNQLSVPRKAGYIFQGYYTYDGVCIFDANGYQTALLIDRDMELYARWQPLEYTIIYDANGATIPSGETSRTVFYGDTLSLFPVPLLENYIFDGWYAENSRGNSVRVTDEYGYVFDEYSAFTSQNYRFDGSSITFYAVFTIKQYKVYLNYNDSAYETKELTVDHGMDISNIILPEIDTGSRVLLGWSTMPNALVEFTGTFTADVTLYAIWKDYCTLTLYLDEDNAIEEKLFKGEEYSAVPEKFGYEFMGWYPNTLFSGNPINTIVYSTTQTTYYARWIEEIYTIELISEEGNLYDSYEYKITSSLDLPEMESKGEYPFLGWCKNEDLSDEPINSIAVGSYGNLKLYPKWRNYTILNCYVNGVIKNDQNVTYGETYKLPIPAYGTGYQFEYWYLDTNGTEEVLTDETGESLSVWSYQKLSSDVYAKISLITYTVELMQEDGGIYGSYDYDVESYVELPVLNAKGDFPFLGWCKNEDLSDEPLSALKEGSHDILKLYPKWRDYTVLTCYGDDGKTYTVTARYGQDFNIGAAAMLSGKKFCYWYTVIGNEEVILTDENGAGLFIWDKLDVNLSVYPKYKSYVNITLSYANPVSGETQTVALGRYVEGDNVTINKPAALSSYIVRGYYINSALVSEEQSFEYTVPAGDVTITITYTIAYDTDLSELIGYTVYKFNGHYYALIKRKASSWNDAKSHCEFLGGHLVTITSEEENSAVIKIMKYEAPGNYNCWLGASDVATEGVWQWVTGESFTYTNWGKSEPSGGTRENYLGYNSAYTDYKWNDSGDNNSSYYLCEWESRANFNFIITRDLTVIDGNTETFTIYSYNGHYYAIVTTSMFWNDAEKYCEYIGGHLATISDAAENSFITKMNVYSGVNTSLFIGLSDAKKEGDWTWITGEPANYINWNSGEPNGGTNANYAQIYNSGKWDDLNNSSGNKFIIEWDSLSEIGITRYGNCFRQIRTASELAALSSALPNTEAELMNDIDLTTMSWVAFDFAGKLNGNGYTISGLTVNSSDTYAGLFRIMKGTLSNVNFENVSIVSETTNSASTYCGIVAYLNGGVIENVTVFSGSISSTWAETGGIVGSATANSVIRNCVNHASVTSVNVSTSVDTKGTSGGIVGWLPSVITIEGCSNYGAVTGTYEVGGIIGGMADTQTLTNLANYGDISGTATVGGIVGGPRKSLTIDGCKSLGKITATGSKGKYLGTGSATYKNLAEIEINSVEEMYLLENNVAQETYLLTGNIDMSGIEWTPINLAATLNGNGYSIVNLSLTSSSGNLGMFNTISGTLTNTVFENVSITSTVNTTNPAVYVGGVCGVLTGTLSNVTVKGSVTGDAGAVGGLVGYMSAGIITECCNYATVYGRGFDGSGSGTVGGIVAWLVGGKVEDCMNYGAVQAVNRYAGGIVGYTTVASLSSLVNKGEIIGTNSVGGIVGSAKEIVLSSLTNESAVNGTSAVGGIVGEATKVTIDGCKSVGKITATGSYGKYVGTGTATYLNLAEIEINSVDDLWKLDNNIAQETYSLTGDIDMSGIDWAPINLAATLNGNGYSIVNLSLTSSSGNLGMFNTISGTISNTVFENVSVTSTSYTLVTVGTVCVTLTGTLENIEVKSGTIVTDVADVGGLVGKMTAGSIINCVNRVDITGNTDESTGTTGGIVGWFATGGTITGCVNYGDITGKHNTAGIAGAIGTSGSISDCINYGTISGKTLTAGIVGDVAYAAPLSNLTNHGNVTGTTYVGGLISKLTISGNATYNSSLVNDGKITGTDYVGGIIGYLWDYRHTGYSNGYFTVTLARLNNGGVVAGENYVGGLIGYTKVYAEHNSGYTSVIKLSGSTLTNSGNVTGTSFVGGLFGYAYANDTSSVITAGTSSAIITAEYIVGGLAGQLEYIKLSECDNIGSSVIATGYRTESNDYFVYLGGYVGAGYAIENCINTIDITYTNRGRLVGGLAGVLWNSTVSGCSNSGNITADRAKDVGGLVGKISVSGSITLTALENSGTVSGADNVGGIIGQLWDYRHTGYSDGYFTVTQTKLNNGGEVVGENYVGGLIGYTKVYAEHNSGYTSLIKVSGNTLTNTGNVTGTSFVGGLFGYAYANDSSSVITAGTSSGAITAVQYYVGALVGKLEYIALDECDNTGSTVALTGCYIDTNNNKFAYLGGYAGYGYIIKNCINTVAIQYNGTGAYVGGIVGYATGALTDCNNTADITVGSIEHVGGIAGRLAYAGSVTLSGLENSGNITGGIKYVGGIAGYLYDYTHTGYNNGWFTVSLSKLSNSGQILTYWDGDGEPSYDGTYVGGLFGGIAVSADHNSGHTSLIKISGSNLSNSGDIKGYDYVGGLFGSASANDTSSSIVDYSSTGEVGGSGTNVDVVAGAIQNISLVS